MDPYNWITDPTPDQDPGLFFSGFKMPAKNKFLFSEVFFAYYLL
jgi:hypothetical protein